MLGLPVKVVVGIVLHVNTAMVLLYENRSHLQTKKIHISMDYFLGWIIYSFTLICRYTYQLIQA